MNSELLYLYSYLHTLLSGRGVSAASRAEFAADAVELVFKVIYVVAHLSIVYGTNTGPEESIK